MLSIATYVCVYNYTELLAGASCLTADSSDLQDGVLSLSSLHPRQSYVVQVFPPPSHLGYITAGAVPARPLVTFVPAGDGMAQLNMTHLLVCEGIVLLLYS